MEKSSDRLRAGMLASVVGIALNFMLAAAKIAAGIYTGLISVVADGFNNLGDCGSSAVTLISFRISGKPADKEHPYGHRRAEYIAAMLTGFIVLSMSVELLRESVGVIVSGSAALPESWVLWTLAASVAVKAVMAVFYGLTARKIQSDALRAASLDSACDCLATSTVIAGLLLFKYLNVSADGWVGICVALFILWQGIAILKDAGSKLLGQAPDPRMIAGIRALLLSGEGVLGIHDLKVYGYGGGVYFGVVHIEMDSSLPALCSHAAIDALERRVAAEFNVNLTAHLDPVDLADEETIKTGELVRGAISRLNAGFRLHDFRIVRGEKTKLVFDVVAPFSCKLSDGQIKSAVIESVKEIGDYDISLRIERE